MTLTEGITLVSLGINLLLLLFQSQTKAAVAELKAGIYRDFVLKADLQNFQAGRRHASS